MRAKNIPMFLYIAVALFLWGQTAHAEHNSAHLFHGDDHSEICDVYEYAETSSSLAILAKPYLLDYRAAKANFVLVFPTQSNHVKLPTARAPPALLSL